MNHALTLLSRLLQALQNHVARILSPRPDPLVEFLEQLAQNHIAILPNTGPGRPVTEAGPPAESVAASPNQRPLAPGVLEWVHRLPEALRDDLLRDGWRMRRLAFVLYGLRPLPPPSAFEDYVRLVPNWAEMHGNFSRLLLRRVAHCHISKQALDAGFWCVHDWLTRRSATMNWVPSGWADAVHAAREEAGLDLERLRAMPFAERSAGAAAPQPRQPSGLSH